MTPYNVIEVFTSEEARHKNRPLYKAIVDYVRDRKIAARCLVTRGIAGCYENGEIATHGVEILTFNMPLKIEIVLPSPELSRVLPAVEEMVTDGIVVVEEMVVRSHRTRSRLLPRQILARDAMTPDPVRVTPRTPAGEIVRLLAPAGFHGMPVVDDAGRPVGIVTQGDLIRRAGMPVRLGLLSDLDPSNVAQAIESMSGKTAAEVMSRPVITVPEDETVAAAVDLMIKHGIKRLPVANASGSLVGMLSRFDVFRTISHEAPDWRALRSPHLKVESLRTVGDIMFRDARTVLPDAPVEEVIRVIDTSDIQRVAVVDREGRFLGLISDKMLLSAFAAHRAGLWDYLVSKLPFTEMGRKHKEFVDQMRARTAADVMKRDAVVVHEDALIDEAVRVMTARNIKRLPVLDRDGKFKGMVSRDALLRAGTGHA
jgi:CBS domain-containing protein